MKPIKGTTEETIDLAINRAWVHQSKLSHEQLAVHGKTSDKVRHLLNNLFAGFNDTVYIEAGLWVGASLVAALHGNRESFRRVWGLDNWSQTPRPFVDGQARDAFYIAFHEHISEQYGSCVDILEKDLFTLSTSDIDQPVSILYYDADHDRTRDGVLALMPFLEDEAIVILDDWNAHDIDKQWEDVVRSGEFDVVREWVLPSRHRQDKELWWCGFYVAMVKRKGS